MSDGTTLPGWMDGIEDDVVSDLASARIAIGPETDAATLTEAQRQTVAATYLRRMAAIQRDIDVLDATEEQQLAILEHQRQQVRLTYAQQKRPLMLRREMYEGQVKIIAALTEWGKKKSADTPHGTYGVRSTPATVKLVDPEAYLAWARTYDPAHVRVTAKMPYSVAREYLNNVELAECEQRPEWAVIKQALTGAETLPPGVERVPASVEPYAKPVSA